MSNSTSSAAIISSTTDLQEFLSSIDSSTTLYIDLEGNRLSRHGTISIITILLHPQGTARLIDVFTLGKSAFSTTTPDSKSLKTILEDKSIPKALWDVRNDADALWSLYQVSLSGVIDVQLLENGSRPRDRTNLSGLEKAIQYDLKPGYGDQNSWSLCKRETQGCMAADIFSKRPMAARTIEYCINDVKHLPELHAVYLRRIDRDMLAKAKLESVRRLELARSPAYDPFSDRKHLGPWGRR